MEEIEFSKPYSIVKQLDSQVNNKELSDVTFVVGEDGIIIYAIRSILALGSPVFKQMFFGDLKEPDNKSILVPDLTSTGFLNMLRYIYGHSVIDFELSTLSDTYKAGDKYLVYGLVDSLCDHIKNSSICNAQNSCILLDQLTQIQNQNLIPLDAVISIIRTQTPTVLTSKHFLNLSLKNLIKILKMENLQAYEFDILTACSRWVKAQCQKQNESSTHKIFDPIKNLIRFSDLSITQMAQFSQLDDLLSMEEVGSLFLHLTEKSRSFMIKCETQRKPFK